uniref:HDC19174 n=1 Tax=Drosophila melanogaster TaxID=7227 RepID=Q6IIA7_DROME|nr:TPA_inf: HDC19174 [Drosophila melanogaster]
MKLPPEAVTQSTGNNYSMLSHWPSHWAPAPRAANGAPSLNPLNAQLQLNHRTTAPQHHCTHHPRTTEPLLSPARVASWGSQRCWPSPVPPAPPAPPAPQLHTASLLCVCCCHMRGMVWVGFATTHSVQRQRGIINGWPTHCVCILIRKELEQEQHQKQ